MNRNLIFGVIVVAVVIFLGGRDKVIEFECFSDDGKDLVGQITEFSFLKKLHWEGDFDAKVSTEDYVMWNFLRGEKLGNEIKLFGFSKILIIQKCRVNFVLREKIL